MVTLDKALEIVLNSAQFLGSERVDIAEALNRVLAEDVTTDIDIPPFDKATMDGYACRRKDLANELTVVETIPAGCTPAETIGPNQCAEIMTGAVPPAGADCVIMKEYVRKPTENTIRFIRTETADNIRPKAQDAGAGDIVLRKRLLLRPPHIALLATVGCTRPLVAERPRVGVIATGSELVEPDTKPGPSQIRNSNSFQLAAQAQAAGALAINYGLVPDSADTIDSAFKKASAENDVVIISGGISMGKFDLVKNVLTKNSVKLLFEKVSAEPGRPAVFGTAENAFCFGLAGNPVSCFVSFELLVKPFLYKLMGCDFNPQTSCAILQSPIKRKNSDRDSYLPVVFTEPGKVALIPYHGSAHITSLCHADALLHIPAGTTHFKKGSTVPVRHI
jgi:molybdopterin molybdotransferase